MALLISQKVGGCSASRTSCLASARQQQWQQQRTVTKEMKCSGDSEILYEIVRDTTRIPEEHELISVISRTISCIISESPLHFIYFLTVCAISIVITFNRMWADRGQKLALPSLLHPLSPLGMLTRHAKIRYEQLHPFSLSSDLPWPHPTTQYRTQSLTSHTPPHLRHYRLVAKVVVGAQL